MKRVAIAFLALLLSGCQEFTPPEINYPNKEAAMDACLDYLVPAVKRQIEKDRPETYKEQKARWEREKDLPLDQRSSYVKESSRFKNSDGKYQILDIYCEPLERSKLFGWYTWMNAIPRVSWLKIPAKECDYNCHHEIESVIFFDWDNIEFDVFRFTYPDPRK